MLLGFASNVLAAPLDVTFTPDPLFNEANFLPLDETSGTATVTNDSGATQNILTEAINVLDSNNFGSLLHLKIVGSSGTLFDDSLSDFFSTAGEVSLGAVSNGESKIFTYTISFIDSSNNSYQGKTLGFDICVGFEGGVTHCGDIVVGGENDTGGGGGGGGGGSSGGGGGGPIILTIVNEQTADISGFPTATATITWSTNVLSTSQVVYGPTPPVYILDMNAVYFGYPFGTVEDPTKVLNHSVLVTGLVSGQTYVYRVVSRASPPTISFERYFTVPSTGSLLAQAGSSNFTGGNSPGNTDESTLSAVSSAKTSVSAEASSGGGDNDTNSGESVSPTEENDTSSNNNLATVLVAGFDNILSTCSLIALLILLAIYIIWMLWLRKEYEKNLVSGKEILNKFFLFFGGSSAVVVFVLLLFSEYCPVPVLLTAVMICLYAYAYRKFKG